MGNFKSLFRFSRANSKYKQVTYAPGSSRDRREMDYYCTGLKIVANNKSVPLKSIDVDVTVKGFISCVTSTLVFKNVESAPIEAVYEFPLDEQSAVFYFEAKIDGRTIIAECQEKKQAKDTYNEAVSHGYSAMLMEEADSSSDIFRCLVGNLPANAEAVIKFSYVNELSLQPDGILKFSLPTLLNPRYNPKVEDGGTLNPVSPPLVEPGKALPYMFNFKARVINNGHIVHVKSEKDQLKVSLNSDKTEAEVILEAFNADHDVTLEIAYEDPFKPNVIMEYGQENRAGLLKQDILMLNFLPSLQESDRSSKHEFIFVIDRSGSMQGSRIMSVQETLLLFLKSLPIGCYFNIVGFGSHFEFLFPEGSKEYSEISLEAAMDYQKKLDAEFGGTEILMPLQSIYSKAPMETHSRQVLLLTDGEVHNTNAVIDEVRKNAKNTRVFTFGIGEGASTALVKGVARAGGGTAEFIKEKERMQPLVMKTLKAAMQASVTDLHLDWQLGGQTPSLVQVPEKMPPLFADSRLIVYAIAKEKSVLDGRVELKGKIGNRPIQFSLEVHLTAPSTSSTDDSMPIHRLAAKAQIQQLQDQEKDDSDKNKAAIILLSTAANIISRHTSMVGVDKERPDKIIGEMMQRRVPVSGYMASRCMMAMPMMMCRSMAPRMVMADAPLGAAACGVHLDLGAGASAADEPEEMDLESCDMVSDVILSAPQKAIVGYMSVVSLQSFSGSWKFNDDLATVVGKARDALQQLAPIKSLDVWATLLALAVLFEKYVDKKDEWEMIEAKAMQWLSVQDMEGHAVAELLNSAKKAISTS